LKTNGEKMQRAEIRIAGHLDPKWAEWFEGFDLTYTENGETILTGCVADQAALYGLIAKLRDLGVVLISVNFDLLTDPHIKSKSPRKQ
jgi:hypothetical protein